MHELALAEEIVRIAARHAQGRRVTRVEVKVGRLRQVVPDALDFSFHLVAEGTDVDGAELAIETVPAAVRCNQCGEEGEVAEFPLACPACGSLDTRVVRGEELLVSELELEEEPEPA